MAVGHDERAAALHHHDQRALGEVHVGEVTALGEVGLSEGTLGQLRLQFVRQFYAKVVACLRFFCGQAEAVAAKEHTREEKQQKRGNAEAVAPLVDNDAGEDEHRPHEEDVFRCERHAENWGLKPAATCSSVAADSSTKTAD